MARRRGRSTVPRTLPERNRPARGPIMGRPAGRGAIGTPNVRRFPARDMERRNLLIAAVVAILVLAAVFFAYGGTALLLDFVNLRYCG